VESVAVGLAVAVALSVGVGVSVPGADAVALGVADGVGSAALAAVAGSARKAASTAVAVTVLMVERSFTCVRPPERLLCRLRALAVGEPCTSARCYRSLRGRTGAVVMAMPELPVLVIVRVYQIVIRRRFGRFAALGMFCSVKTPGE
jgi:hypothetical protein